MLCTPYRCSQEQKNYRRQLCNWSGKALSLVGLEEVLVAAYGHASRDKLPFNELSSDLSKVVSQIENDSNICGICGKPKKPPPRKFVLPKALYTGQNEPVDRAKIAQSSTVDQPIDLSKNSKHYNNASPSTLAGATPNCGSLVRSSNGIISPSPNAASAKRQRVRQRPPMQRDVLQMAADVDNLDPNSIVQQLASSLVNNWTKLQPQHSTTSPNHANDSFTLNQGPSLPTAGLNAGLPASRPQHHRTSGAATAGSLNRNASAGNNAPAGHVAGEPSDISDSTLSDQDAMNRFKQWRVASWVQEASRHQREGSAVVHHEESVQDISADLQSSANNSRNVGTTSNALRASRTSPPPPLSNAIRNTPSMMDKSASRKRVTPLPPQQQQHQQLSKQQHSASPLPASATATGLRGLSSQLQSSNTDAVSSKRVRGSDQTALGPQASSSSNGLLANNASLNNLTSVLSSLFPTNQTPTNGASGSAGSSLLPAGISPNDLDALLTVALQNWGGSTSGGTSSQQNALSQQQQQNDPTAALLTAAYQQQMQAAAMLQLQYASIFSNPLLYSNLLLGGNGASAPTNNQQSLSAAGLGSANVDALLTESLLAMLGGNAGTSSSASTLPAANSLFASAAQSLLSSSAKRPTEGQQQQQHHRQNNNSSSNHNNNNASVNISSSSANRHSAVTSVRPRSPHRRNDNSDATTLAKVASNQTDRTFAHKSVSDKKQNVNNSTNALSEPVIKSLCNDKKSKLPQLPVNQSSSHTIVGANKNGKVDCVEDLSIRAPSRSSKPQHREEEATATVERVNGRHSVDLDKSSGESKPVAITTKKESSSPSSPKNERREASDTETPSLVHQQNGNSKLQELSGFEDDKEKTHDEAPAQLHLAKECVVSDVEEVLHAMNGNSPDESSNQYHDQHDSRDSHSSTHLDCNSSSPLPNASRNGKATTAEIIDLQTV